MSQNGNNIKRNDLQKNTTDAQGQQMNTDQGTLINDDHNSLKSGTRGSTLMEDFILREKITHFDHERIPERVVHARGSAAHGTFKLHKDLSEYTTAGLLTDVNRETSVFVRFSTVAGSRGSTDMPRDVRGFAVKFYTEEGNFDLVGNNIPVFFIQDAMQFPDLVHAVKPEQDNEIPQASSAHDTFWDFISLMPESTHMIMWLMSDRAIPRSFRMMEGFGVHTFRLVNAAGKSTFVKFHWKPRLGTHAVVWDEAQKISGKDPDFHRRDLWEAIESGNYPEWDLGLQLIPETDEHKFDFDLLDPTKIVPEELVPVEIVGTLTLDRNPDNFFAETEQVAFHPGHIVPGIDFTNDPLLQGRLFSYTDTQLSRLGTPNFHEIPINRSINTIYNNQREAQMRMQINKGKASYSPNSIGNGCPYMAKASQGGFTSFNERVDGQKIRGRSQSFMDHFSQAALFYRSQSKVEQQHIKNAFSFELSKCAIPEIRARMVNTLTYVNTGLADHVAAKLGMEVPVAQRPVMNGAIPADGDPEHYAPVLKQAPVERSSALSMLKAPAAAGIATRKIAVLLPEDVDAASLQELKEKISAAGAELKIIASRLGEIISSEGTAIPVDLTFFNTSSVLHDAVFLVGTEAQALSLLAFPEVVEFIDEQYRHCKVLGATEGASVIFDKLNKEIDGGLITNGDIDGFIEALSQHRFWEREQKFIK